MVRTLFFVGLLCGACSSSDDKANCPDVSGYWTITSHCESSLIGMPLKVTANACALSFGPPFDGYSGQVSADGEITVKGPQTCSGVASTSEVLMSCTPNSCMVKLER